MGRFSLNGSIFVLATFVLFIGEDGLHWKYAVDKLFYFGITCLVIYLITKFYKTIDKFK